MFAHLSLRLRLFVLILSPLVVMAVVLGYWRFTVAQDTAEELFDRSLFSTALAISRDVTVSGGDAILSTTRDQISDAAGGEIFYHVTGPAGIYVTGYAYPPSPGAGSVETSGQPFYFEAIYRGEPVRVLRVTEPVTIDDQSGDATVAVWQRLSDREAFARELGVRAAGLMGALLATLALVVWFGVQRGLRPLTNLQDAIAVRSPDDLSTIKRPVPIELRGIVVTLNRLFGQVASSIDAHQVFISDAAHQLRNPTAAIQSMAEAIGDARTDDERRRRINELIRATRSSTRLAEQLLSLDRLRHDQAGRQESFNLYALTRDICRETGAFLLSHGTDFELIARDRDLPVHADRFFVSEAIKNLIDNAQKHGGPNLSRITVETAREDGMVTLTVADDGTGLVPENEGQAFSRFGQIEPTDGSGLGLAIVASVAESHGGSLRINAVEQGASVTFALPAAANS